MRRYFKVAILPFIAVSFLLCGCAGQTKPYIPGDIVQLKDDEARVILTREKQIAGAASSVIFIDAGKEIVPNAILYLHNLDIEDLIKNENVASVSGGLIDFMWFNPKRVRPLHCGNMKDGCINYNNRWPRKNKQNILFGKGKHVVLDEANNEIKYKTRFLIDDKIDAVVTPDGRLIHPNAQVIGSAEVGDTLIWDRQPGIMRLGSVWYDGIGFMPQNIHVESGRTYFIHYTTRLGQRWELERIE